ncbi:MAG: AAA family ATPase [Promethearchaeota archaeon]
MKVIGFCGYPGSGKSTAIESVKDLGEIITMGDVVRNEADKREITHTDKNLGNLAKKLREEGGPNVIAENCVELILSKTCEIIFIDGLRSMDEVKIFRTYWKFPVIAIIADQKIRFERLVKRGRSDSPKSLEELENRDKREEQFGLKEVVKQANIKIDSNIPEKEFKMKTRKIVEHLLKN